MDEAQEGKVDKSKKIDPYGIQVYGKNFSGYQKAVEYNEFIPAFKEYYYALKKEDPQRKIRELIRCFNDEIVEPLGKRFHPPISTVRVWGTKWDWDLSRQNRGQDFAMIDGRQVEQAIPTRDEQGRIVIGKVEDNHLDMAVRTLGGELLNDAMQMLADDQKLEEIYDPETLIKRRNYIVNVFAHGTRLVHGKAALMLKASEEKRNTAGFLMSLLARATAGQMSDAEMELLKSSYSPKPNGNS